MDYKDLLNKIKNGVFEKSMTADDVRNLIASSTLVPPKVTPTLLINNTIETFEALDKYFKDEDCIVKKYSGKIARYNLKDKPQNSCDQYEENSTYYINTTSGSSVNIPKTSIRLQCFQNWLTCCRDVGYRNKDDYKPKYKYVHSIEQDLADYMIKEKVAIAADITSMDNYKIIVGPYKDRTCYYIFWVLNEMYRERQQLLGTAGR